MLDACQRDIESFYSRYAGAEGITIAEAKKRVSQADIAAYERKAAKYVREKNFSKQANEEMRLYNATMRINRMEMLRANIGLELIAGHDELNNLMGEMLQGRTMDELKRMSGILGKTVLHNTKKAAAIVNGSFHNGTFSDRIWQYQDLMREDLGKLLHQGLIQGKNPRALTKDLRKYLLGDKVGKGATYNVERLMRTELRRVQTEAQKQSFERNGFEMYRFHCNVNPSKSHTCDICKRLASQDKGFGKGIYLVKDMMPGTNAPPMHPNCRCSTSAYEDSDEYEAWLDYLDKGGTTAEWNATGKAEWKKKKDALAKYGKMSFSQKKELIYTNEQKIDRLRKEKKQAELEGITATSTEDMAEAFARAKDLQRQVEELLAENYEVQNALGLPTNAKERFLAQNIDFNTLPHDIRPEDYDAVSSWTRTSYVDINRYMRYGDKGVRPQSITDAHALERCLERNVVQEPFAAKRGINVKAMDAWYGGESWRKEGFKPDGAVIVDKGFCATSPALHGGFGGDVVAYIDIPAGAHGAYIASVSGAKEEEEFLLQCGTFFRVDRVEITYDTWNEPHYEVYLRVIVDE
jgi:SPP1 gp7 family putative phage head morphogenesis protein